MTPRSDLHSPKNLVTEDYEYVFGLDTRPSEYSGWQDPAPKEHEVGIDNLLSSWDGSCAHCGARGLRWLAIMLHKPSGEYLGVGFTCLDNRFSLATADYQRLKRAGELDRQAQKVKQARLAWVAANPDLAFLGDKEPALPEASKRNGFLKDLSRKLREYGSLSDKQAEAARKSLVRDVEWAAERAAKEAAKAAAEGARGPAQPVPTGRQTVSGEVVGLKEVEDQFARVSRYSSYVPTIWKMVVLDDRGFKIFLTVPSSLSGVERGARVTFTATLEQSKDDPFFGFGKRPTGGRQVEAVTPEAPAAPRTYEEIFG